MYVYTGFLRIRERATLKDLLLDPLDDTRIHPESYFMAVKMCADASGSREVDLYDASKYQPVVEDVMYDSSKAIRKMMREEEDRWEDRRSREPRDQLSGAQTQRQRGKRRGSATTMVAPLFFSLCGWWCGCAFRYMHRCRSECAAS